MRIDRDHTHYDFRLLLTEDQQSLLEEGVVHSGSTEWLALTSNDLTSLHNHPDLITSGSIDWIDLTDGSNTVLHNHANLVSSGELNWIDLTDGGLTNLHSHDVIPNLVTSGTNWTDLTDGGNTTLHTHTLSNLDGLATSGILDHNLLTNLSTDNHGQYLKIQGRTPGQYVYGGTGSGDNLQLLSTPHANKGGILFGTNTFYDESDDQFGINTLAPSAKIHAIASSAGETLMVLRDGFNTCDFTVSAVSAGIISIRSGGGDNLYISSNADTTGHIRITTGGLVGVGGTASYRLDVQQDSASTYAQRIFHDGNNANRYGLLIQCGEDTPTTATSQSFIDFAEGDGTVTGAIIGNSAGVVSYLDTSDIRHKTNISLTKVNGSDIIKKIELIEFNRKKPDGTLYTKTDIGFSAQNLLEVFPASVAEISEGKLGVAKADLIPLLVKALQELQEEVRQLKAELTKKE